jgi:ADP-heptose:LPS heptosyltransferase
MMNSIHAEGSFLENGNHVRSIAIFRALQLGDMLCSIPAVRAIKNRFPEAKLTLIGLPWQKYFVQRFSHYFDHFLQFPGWPGLPEQPYTIPEVMHFLDVVQKKKFDLVIQMQGNGYIVNPMCMLFGARHYAGLRKAEDFCPDERLFPIMTESDHEIVRFMKIAEALGAKSQGLELEFPILEEEEKEFEHIKSALGIVDKRYVCLHAGARDPRRRWAPCNFARIGDALAARGFTVVLTGSVEEQPILDELESCLHTSSVNLVKLCGHVGIGELAALIKHSSGLVSNDTGVSHIASALKVRSVIMFSPYSDPCRWAPLDRNLHKIIHPEESKNVMYVVNSVLSHLDLQYDLEPVHNLS